MTSLANTPEITAVSKLLLNAWSAEYALRIKPVKTSREYLNSALSWVFPQAYYAALFSARAVLAVDGVNIANPETIEKLLVQWARAGKYGPAITTDFNPFADLLQHRITNHLQRKRLSAPEAAAIQVKLTEKVHATSVIHETYIADRLGGDVYQSLIDTIPQYLRDSFVEARTILILSDD